MIPGSASPGRFRRAFSFCGRVLRRNGQAGHWQQTRTCRRRPCVAARARRLDPMIPTSSPIYEAVLTLYLDTEFNGHGGQLLSMAIVSTDGAEFYGVLPLPASIHPWVAEHVVPKFGRAPEPVAEFRFRLRCFMEPRWGETIIADWPADVELFLNVMRGPNYESSFMGLCTMQLVPSGDVQPDNPHNALSDARALMRWHQAHMR